MARHPPASPINALLDALGALGARSSNGVALPPATHPRRWGREVGEGVLKGQKGAESVPPRAGALGAAPEPSEALEHEGARSIAELGAILWHAGAGADDAPELARWIVAPHADPIIGLTISRRRLAEYAAPDPFGRTCAVPGERVWIIEIERAKGDRPSAVALWRSRGADGAWWTRCACIWTHGKTGGSQSAPLVIGAQWDHDANHASASAAQIGVGVNDAQGRAARQALIKRRAEAIGPAVIAKIVVPAILAWLDHHEGAARPTNAMTCEPGKRSARTTSGHAEHCPRFQPVRAPTRTGPPEWVWTKAAHAAEALVIRTAREGWRIGGSCPIAGWRRSWAGYAELGAVAWHSIANLNAQIDAGEWDGIEARCRSADLRATSASPALAATSALVRKILIQTGRAHVAPAPDERTLCALQIPRRLWRALAEAGTCPGGTPEPDLSERWWLVEIERPGDDEPNAIALWEADGVERGLAVFLGVDDGYGGTCPAVLAWENRADTSERERAALAVLGQPVRIDDVDDATRQAQLTNMTATLRDEGRGAVARAKTAIALHLETTNQAPPLRAYRPSEARQSGKPSHADQRTSARGSLFAVERAADPEPPAAGGPGTAQGAGRGGRPLEAQQQVRAHWKRQACGRRLARRRWKLIAQYKRGPAPREDQVPVRRLSEQAASRVIRSRREHRETEHRAK